MTLHIVTIERPPACDRDARLRAHLAAAADGDARAFERLHAELHGPVIAFAVRMLGRYDRAEEVASDTMVAVWRGAAAFEGRSKVTTWVFGIAYRIAMKSRRRFSFEALHRSLDALLERADPAAPGADALVGEGRMADAIGALSPDARALVHMTYYYGFTAAEVGDVAGLPEGTVKTRLAAARRRIARHLEAEGQDG